MAAEELFREEGGGKEAGGTDKKKKTTAKDLLERLRQRKVSEVNAAGVEDKEILEGVLSIVDRFVLDDTQYLLSVFKDDHYYLDIDDNFFRYLSTEVNKQREGGFHADAIRLLEEVVTKGSSLAKYSLLKRAIAHRFEERDYFVKQTTSGKKCLRISLKELNSEEEIEKKNDVIALWTVIVHLLEKSKRLTTKNYFTFEQDPFTHIDKDFFVYLKNTVAYELANTKYQDKHFKYADKLLKKKHGLASDQHSIEDSDYHHIYMGLAERFEKQNFGVELVLPADGPEPKFIVTLPLG